MSRPVHQTISNNRLWQQLSDVLRAHMGLNYSKEHQADLHRGIVAAATDFNFHNAEDCARWLISAPLTQHTITVLAKYLTIGETYFFRDPAAYLALEKKILPQLLHERATTKSIRIWSAGCCTGEEPYSIGIILDKLIPDLTQWNISILATDIDTDFLQKAEQGVYRDWSFRNTESKIKTQYFLKNSDNTYSIKPAIKKLVTFSYLNLIKDVFPAVENDTSAIDIIFCRNVLMYFTQPDAITVIEKLSQSLLNGGWIFLSPVDFPTQVNFLQLEPRKVLKTTVYQKEMNSCKVSTHGADKITHTVVEEKTDIITHKPRANNKTTGNSHHNLDQNPEPQHRHSIDINALYQTGCYRDVVNKSIEKLNAEPEDLETMIILARSHANLGELSEAQTWCESALAVDITQASWWYLHATIMEEIGHINRAKSSLRKAQFLEPDNPLVLFATGNLLRKRGNQQQARKYFSESLNLLQKYHKQDIIPGSSGMAAGTLTELIQSIISGGNSNEK